MPNTHANSSRTTRRWCRASWAFSRRAWRSAARGVKRWSSRGVRGWSSGRH